MSCLDTSALLDAAGRSGPKVQRAVLRCLHALIARGESLATTRFNVAELWVGIHRSRDPRRERVSVENLLSGLDILEFDASAAEVYGRITAYLQEMGRPVGDMDVLIASVAIVGNRGLVTGNPKHFTDIPGLEIHCYG